MAKKKPKKFTLLDLITTAGVENCKVQYLEPSMTNISISKKNGTLVTFGTDQLTPTDIAVGRQRMIGVIVWIPLDRIEVAKAAAAKCLEGETG